MSLSRDPAKSSSKVAATSMFTASADAYARFVGRYGHALARALLAEAGVAAGQRVLDVGCGPGPLAAEAAAIVGEERVAAVDPSEPFAEACRARLPGADVRVAAAESLPFADDTFDIVLSQLVVNFMADAEAGVAEMRRVAVPGGVVASCVWDYGGGMRMLRAFWDAAVAVDPAGAAPHDEGRSMRYSTAPELERLWRAAGLDEVRTSALDVEADYEDFDDLWEPFTFGIGPAGAYIASLDDDRRQTVRERLRATLGEPQGAFTLTARAWCVRGAKMAE
jgi:SAM-dependent methyltransferase